MAKKKDPPNPTQEVDDEEPHPTKTGKATKVSLTDPVSLADVQDYLCPPCYFTRSMLQGYAGF